MMRSLKYVFSGLLFSLLLVGLLPMEVSAQAMTVIGGNTKASDCYLNAQLAGQLRSVSSLIKPCNYALEHVKLTRRDRAATFANRGIIVTYSEDFEAAMKDFEVAASLYPNAAELYVNRGNVFFFKKNFNQAIADYSKALDLDIRQAHIAHLDRGLAYEKTGNITMAEKDYRQALQYQPEWQLAENFLSRLLSNQLGSE